MKTSAIPVQFRPTHICEVDPTTIDPQKNAKYIIERVADFGNDQEARWVLDFYDKTLLQKVIFDSKCLRPRTKALWTLLLNN